MRLFTESPQDWWEVETLFDLAFAPGREALSSYRLREGVPPVGDLCHVPLRDEERQAFRGGGALLAASAQAASGPFFYGAHRGSTRFQPGRGGSAAYQSSRRSLAAGEGMEPRAHLGRRRTLNLRPPLAFNRLDGVEMPPPTNPDRILGLRASRPAPWDGAAGTGWNPLG